MTLCSFPECPHESHGHGLCTGHLYQRKQGKGLHALGAKRVLRARMDWVGKDCTFPGCDKKQARWAQGLCYGHRRQKAVGLPLRPLQARGEQKRWTRDEDTTLRQLYVNERLTMKEIGERMGRRVCQIENRVKLLKARRRAKEDSLTASQLRSLTRKSEGLCVTCGKPGREGKATCRSCNDRATWHKRLHPKPTEDDAEPVDNTPRCRCSLRLLSTDERARGSCNSCLPGIEHYATARGDGGTASISVRSKAA